MPLHRRALPCHVGAVARQRRGSSAPPPPARPQTAPPFLPRTKSCSEPFPGRKLRRFGPRTRPRTLNGSAYCYRIPKLRRPVVSRGVCSLAGRRAAPRCAARLMSAPRHPSPRAPRLHPPVSRPQRLGRYCGAAVARLCGGQRLGVGARPVPGAPLFLLLAGLPDALLPPSAGARRPWVGPQRSFCISGGWLVPPPAPPPLVPTRAQGGGGASGAKKRYEPTDAAPLPRCRCFQGGLAGGMAVFEAAVVTAAAAVRPAASARPPPPPLTCALASPDRRRQLRRRGGTALLWRQEAGVGGGGLPRRAWKCNFCAPGRPAAAVAALCPLVGPQRGGGISRGLSV